MFNANSGYSGYSMSSRAVAAYENSEKPISKWTKAEILERVNEILTDNEIIPKFSMGILKKLKVTSLKNLVLEKSSWHHTSSHFNKTDFYSVSEYVVENLTDEKILNAAENAAVEIPKQSKVFKANLHYLEWSGTRKHPKATERVLENVNIEERGCFYYASDENGKEILKKKIASNGTWIERL